MPEIEIELADDEDILRVFLRWPDEPWGFAKLRKSDFARYMAKHSGMSMLRLKYLRDRDEALNWFESNKLKGLAICKAKQLKALGLRFIGTKLDDKHISVRCPPCNLAANYPVVVLCQSTQGGNCLIDLTVVDSMCLKVYMSIPRQTGQPVRLKPASKSEANQQVCPTQTSNPAKWGSLRFCNR